MVSRFIKFKLVGILPGDSKNSSGNWAASSQHKRPFAERLEDQWFRTDDSRGAILADTR